MLSFFLKEYIIDLKMVSALDLIQTKSQGIFFCLLHKIRIKITKRITIRIRTLYCPHRMTWTLIFVALYSYIR